MTRKLNHPINTDGSVGLEAKRLWIVLVKLVVLDGTSGYEFQNAYVNVVVPAVSEGVARSRVNQSLLDRGLEVRHIEHTQLYPDAPTDWINETLRAASERARATGDIALGCLYTWDEEDKITRMREPFL